MSHKSSEPHRTVFVGTFIHCKTLQQLDICVKGAIGVDQGRITFFEREVEDVTAVAHNHGWEHFDIITANDTQFFVPGFIGKCGGMKPLPGEVLIRISRYTYSCPSVS